MYKNKKIILTICARGGSIGVPNKNIKKLLGKPLIQYSIEQAKKVKWIDRIVISTDSENIKKVCEINGLDVFFLRPKYLSTENAPKIPVFIHAIKMAEKQYKEKYDIWVDLDATSPLRNVLDIKNSIKLLFKEDTLAVITAAPARRNPYFNIVELSKDGYVSISKPLKTGPARRQDAPKAFDMNGSVYVMWKNELFKRQTFFTNKTRLYIMPYERSVDIDTLEDFRIVEYMMKNKN